MLRLLAQIALMDEYRYCLPDLHWHDYTLSAVGHGSNNATVNARKFIELRNGECNFFLMWDCHLETGTGNLVFGGSSQIGSKSDMVDSLLDACLGPILIDMLPNFPGRKGAFFLTCSPFMNMMNSNCFNFIIAFCSGSVIPNNVALNLVKAFNMMAVYKHSVFAAVKIAFGSDIITLTHSPVGVVTRVEATDF
ncbi:hypothetical protein JAAARDRAFT_197093 [Jaapia argillacea MUCL 33604]|uniref:Uncharacterized protein n=1 Tax=Jaapia argillacea MUCL 33604 TaxID=933084 RepID=A0A067PRS3_9AGAM|nr:hypothetical protein JAAARDRAFT_197093 [Jaapia argillacea MUCL 33604]